MKVALTHELCPVPSSLFEDTGDLRIAKSKAGLKKKLQVEISPQNSENPSAMIVDGCAVLWTVSWPSSGTVEDYLQSFLDYLVCLLSKGEIHLIFDRYYDKSIKQCTREMRAEGKKHDLHHLTANTAIPQQKNILTNTQNKVQLIELILDHIRANTKVVSASGHKLVVMGADPIPFEVFNNQVKECPDLKSYHEEADVNIVQRVIYLATKGHSLLQVLCDDTDVFVLLLHFYNVKNLKCSLVMESTVTGRSTIDIKQTVEKHHNVVGHILAAHALSGCDTVSQPFGIGKVTILKAIENGKYVDLLGTNADMSEIVSQAVAFLMACYGSKEDKHMSKARHEIWIKKMSSKNITAAPLLKCLPPTDESFVEHVKRAHLQCLIWLSAEAKDPPSVNPCELGWRLEEGKLLPRMVGENVKAVPEQLMKLIKCSCSSSLPCSSSRCSCYTAKLSCSSFCSCFHQDSCNNPSTPSSNLAEDTDDDD